MTRSLDLALTAVAPAVWGTTYLVTTEMLPQGYPLTVAMLRALPAGLILIAATRALPPVRALGRIAVLGALNFSIFWAALFVAAYRLPGGVAATLGAVQPLIVLLLARLLLGTAIQPMGMVAAAGGMLGVGLLVLGEGAAADPVGIAAALLGAGAMALGVVLTRRWQTGANPLAVAGWQLTAGGLLLLPVALLLEPGLPRPTAAHLAGFAWLGLVGGALTYVLWFRGIASLGPARVTSLGFLSPLTAVVLGWAVLGQRLTPLQLAGAALVLVCVRLGTRAPVAPAPARAPGSAV